MEGDKETGFAVDMKNYLLINSGSKGVVETVCCRERKGLES